MTVTAYQIETYARTLYREEADDYGGATMAWADLLRQNAPKVAEYRELAFKALRDADALLRPPPVDVDAHPKRRARAAKGA